MNRFDSNTLLILNKVYREYICLLSYMFVILYLSISGTCRCDENYTAADCSLNENDPPIVDGINIADGGLCDTEHCSSAFVEGDLFLETTHLTCKMHKFQAIFLYLFSNSNSEYIPSVQMYVLLSLYLFFKHPFVGYSFQHCLQTCIC